MNSLDFTLGLSAHGFIQGMEKAEGSVGRFLETVGKFTGVAAGLEAGMGALKGTGNVIEGVMAAIEKGAALEHLSRATGESVENLFLLQKGLKAVGLDAGGAGHMVFQMQKALGGVNENGEPTAKIFEQLGLNIADLQKMNAPEAMLKIGQSISKLNTSSASMAAGKIFGRTGAMEFLEMARSTDEFSHALKSNAAAAHDMERNAAVFAKIEHLIVGIKGKAQGIFAGIAAGIAPAMEQILQTLNQIDLSGLGKRLGEAAAVFVEAVKEGKLFEFLSGTFDAAAEYAGNVIMGVLGNAGFWEGIWDTAVGGLAMAVTTIGKVFLSLGVLLKAAIVQAFDEAFELIGKTPALGKLAGLGGYKAPSFNETFSAERANAAPAQEMLSQMGKDAFGQFGGGAKGIGGALSSAVANAGGPAQNRLAALYEAIHANVPAIPYTAVDRNGGVNLDVDPKEKDKKKPVEKPQVTNLEKMGFVFGGVSGADHAADTAKNTRETASSMKQLVTFIIGGKRWGADADTWENLHPI
jgi:hypothetical protein